MFVKGLIWLSTAISVTIGLLNPEYENAKLKTDPRQGLSGMSEPEMECSADGE